MFVVPYVFYYPRFSILSVSIPYIIPQNGEYAVFQRLVSFHLILWSRKFYLLGIFVDIIGVKIFYYL
jgi:hypothetical protein